MSLTVKGWNDWACATATMASVHAATTAARRLRIINCEPSTGNQAIQIVIESEGHHYKQQRKTHALSEFHETLGHWPPLGNLDRIVHQVSAIEQRNRQQIQHAETDADERKESEIGNPAEARRLSGVVGDGDRSREMTPRHFADQHLAEHLQAEDGNVDGLGECLAQADERPVLHADQQAVGITLGLLRTGAYAADATAV